MRTYIRDRLPALVVLPILLPFACSLLGRAIIAMLPGCAADMDLGVFDCRVGGIDVGFPLAVFTFSGMVTAFFFVFLAGSLIPLLLGGIAIWRWLLSVLTGSSKR